MPAESLFIAGSEWLWVVVLVVVLLFGARKIPELARAAGRASGEFQRGKKDSEEELGKAKQIASSADIEELRNAARSLGINPESKTTEELREEITKAVGK